MPINMNFKKINKQINKIRSLVDNISEDEYVSAIEQDLLKRYIQDLYDLTLMNGGSKVSDSIEEKKNIKPVVEQVAAKTLEDVAIPPMPIKVTPIEKIVGNTTSHIPPADVREPMESAKEVIVEEIEVVQQATSPIVEQKVAVAEKVVQAIAPMSDDMKELFSESKMDALSDRFSMLPIKDLTKSMGINEKIFTIQELFGGKQEKFNSIMEKLNGFSSYEEAKSFLVAGPAVDFGWTEENKKRKAQTLINLIRRRYF